MIEVKSLTKSYGAFQALRGVSFSIARGEVVGFLGPNGAGKTTTIRMLATLLVPDGGSARVLGHDVVEDADAVRQKISLTGQLASVDEELSGRENLVLLARLLGYRGRQAGRRAEELLAAFGLADAAGRLVKHYSGGMRRRLDIAASIVVTPELMVLDEPTTGLDPRSRNQVWEIVRALVARGTTVLLCTQYLEEADQLADRVGIIADGLIVAEGTPAALKAEVGLPHLDITFAECSDLGRARELLGGVGELRDARAGVDVSVAVAAGAAEIAPVVRLLDEAGFTVASLDLVAPSLDDVFAEKTGRRLEGAASPA